MNLFAFLPYSETKVRVRFKLRSPLSFALPLVRQSYLIAWLYPYTPIPLCLPSVHGVIAAFRRRRGDLSFAFRRRSGDLSFAFRRRRGDLSFAFRRRSILASLSEGEGVILSSISEGEGVAILASLSEGEGVILASLSEGDSFAFRRRRGTPQAKVQEIEDKTPFLPQRGMRR